MQAPGGPSLRQQNSRPGDADGGGSFLADLETLGLRVQDPGVSRFGVGRGWPPPHVVTPQSACCQAPASPPLRTPFIGLGPTPGPLLLALVRPISKESHSEALGLESHPMDLEDTRLSSSSPAPWADTTSPQPVSMLPEPSPSKSRHGDRSFLNII